MKKLIAFAVGLALVTGGLFAADISGHVIGTVKLVGGNSAKQWDIDKYDDRTDPSKGGVTKVPNTNWVGNPYTGGTLNTTYWEIGDNGQPQLNAAGKAGIAGGTLSADEFSYPKNYDFITMGYGKEKGGKLQSGGDLNRLRFEASAELEDGLFGGFLRTESGGWSGFVYWKPIDMLKMTIGVNPDGHFGKDGYAGWMFYQTAADTGVVNPNSIWYGPGGYSGLDIKYRDAFYGGWGENALMLEIKPVDMIGINVAIPFFRGGNTLDVFKGTMAQIDVNLDFGNIALTYAGDSNELADTKDFKVTTERYDTRLAPNNIVNGVATGYRWDTEQSYSISGINASPSKFFLSASIGAIENLSLDVGFAFPLPVKFKDYNEYNDKTAAIHYTTTSTYQAPLAASVAAKYGMGDFALKARVVAKFMGKFKQDIQRSPMDTSDSDYPYLQDYINQDPFKEPLMLLGELMPYYAMSDTMRVYFSLGMSFQAKSKYEYQTYYAPDNWALGDPPSIGKVTYKADSILGWHINPYVEVGSEWGPKFLAGVKIWSDGKKVESPLYNFTRDYDVLNRYAGSKKAIVNWEVPIAMMVSF